MSKSKYGIKEVKLSNGQTAKIDVCKSYEDGHDYYCPKNKDGSGTGVAYASMDEAIKSIESK